MNLDELIQKLMSHRNALTCGLPVRMCIDFGDKGQFEADCDEAFVVSEYVGGSDVGRPIQIMLAYEDGTTGEDDK